MKLGSPKPKTPPPPPKAAPKKSPAPKPAPQMAPKPAAQSKPPDTTTIKARNEQQETRVKAFQETGQRPQLVPQPKASLLSAQMNAALAQNTSFKPPSATEPKPINATTQAVPVEPMGGGEGDSDEHLRTTGYLNIRTVPTTAGNEPIGTIPEGTIVQVTPDADGETRQDGFVHVSWNDTGNEQLGWVSEEFTETSGPPNAAEQQALTDAGQNYINQFSAEQEVSFINSAGSEVAGDGSNRNCGPTSVAMALRDQGLTLPDVPGITHNGTGGADVQAARFHMYNGDDSSRDGVVLQDADDPGAGYQYAPMNGNATENHKNTGFSGVTSAVEAAGGTTEQIGANSTEIATALQNGDAVIVAGTFVEDVPVMAEEGQPHNDQGELLDGDGIVVTTEETKDDTWTRGGGATDHLIAITGMTESGDFIVSDPAHPSNRPVNVSPEQLDAFIRGNPGAITVSGPEPAVPPPLDTSQAQNPQ